VLSHHQAAALYDLRRAPWSPIHVTALAQGTTPGLTATSRVGCAAGRA
jgi:hypothetical protein